MEHLGDWGDPGFLVKILEANPGGQSEDFVRWTLHKVALAIHAMHNKNILHRNIMSENIMMERHGEIKLFNLEMSTMLSEQNSTANSRTGSPGWMAPE